MKSRPNPLYRPRESWQLSVRAQWLWRLFLVVILLALIFTGSFVAAAVFAVVWVAAELLQAYGQK